MSFLLASLEDRPLLGGRSARTPTGTVAAGPAFTPYAVGAVAVVLLYVFFSVIAGVVLVLATGGPTGDLATVPTLPLGAFGPAATLAVLLLPSVSVLLGVLALTAIVHRRPVATLVRAQGAVRWRRVALAAAVWTAVTMVFELVAWVLYPGAHRLTFDPARFLPLLAVALVLVPLQCAAEELLFRGYLLQGLGLVLRRGGAAVLVTSALFAAVHLGNPELERFGRVFILYYAGIGLVLGFATLLDDGLEVAIGAHTANNLWGALVVSFPGSVLDTPAILRMEGVPPEVIAGLGMATAVTSLLVLGRLLGWRRGPAARRGVETVS